MEWEPKIFKKKNKKKCTVGRFLHTGPKKGVEKEYEVYFAQIQDKKAIHTFFVKTENIKVCELNFHSVAVSGTDVISAVYIILNRLKND